MDSLRVLGMKCHKDNYFFTLDLLLGNDNYFLMRNVYEDILLNAKFNPEKQKLLEEVGNLAFRGIVVDSNMSMDDLKAVIKKPSIALVKDNTIDVVYEAHHLLEFDESYPKRIEEALLNREYEIIIRIFEEIFSRTYIRKEEKNKELRFFRDIELSLADFQLTSDMQFLYCILYKSCMTFWENFCLYKNEILEEDLPFPTYPLPDLSFTHENVIQFSNALMLLNKLLYLSFN